MAGLDGIHSRLGLLPSAHGIQICAPLAYPALGRARPVMNGLISACLSNSALPVRHYQLLVLPPATVKHTWFTPLGSYVQAGFHPSGHIGATSSQQDPLFVHTTAAVCASSYRGFC